MRQEVMTSYLRILNWEQSSPFWEWAIESNTAEALLQGPWHDVGKHSADELNVLRHRPTINTAWINRSCCSLILPPCVPSVTGVRRSNIITGWWEKDLLGLYKHLLACIPAHVLLGSLTVRTHRRQERGVMWGYLTQSNVGSVSLQRASVNRIGRLSKKQQQQREAA